MASVAIAGGSGRCLDGNPRRGGRTGVYDSKSRDWVASMALVEKLYPDYKD